MRIFKFFKNKIFRRVMTLLLILAFLILMDMGLGYVLSPVRYANYFTHAVGEIESSGQKVDMVFCGASRTHLTFDPKVFEEKMGLTCVVNAASAGEPMCAAYQMVRDMVERLHPDRIFIGVTWNGLRSTGGLQSRLIAWDMLSAKGKLRMAVDCIGIDEIAYLSSTYRFKDNFTRAKMESNLRKKKELEETNYQSAIGKNEKYYHGYVFRNGTIETGNVPITYAGTFDPNRLTDRNLKYLSDAIDLCKKNGIEVSLITGATSIMRIFNVTNYQEAVDYYADFAKQHGIKYYNVNYLRDRETFLPDEMMQDSNHTNGEGGARVSEVFAEILMKEAAGEDISKYFYADLDELKASVHRVVAVKAKFTTPDKENPALRHVSIISTQNEGVEPIYRVLYRFSEEEEFTVLRDWSPDQELDLDFSAIPTCAIRIEAAATDETLGHAFQDYDVTPKRVVSRWDDNECD